MLLKTKDRCGKLCGEAGMSLKTKEMRVESGNVGEKKGRRWHVVGGEEKQRLGARGWVLGKNNRRKPLSSKQPEQGTRQSKI
jgi:hypothetical protein